MAQGSDFQINGRIEWRTKVPSSDAPFFDSPTFMLLGSEWYLQFSHTSHKGGAAYGFGVQLMAYSRSYDLVLRLIPKVSEDEQEALPRCRTLQTLFSVASYIGHPTDPSGNPTAWEWCQIADRKKVDIWKCSVYIDDSIDRLCKGGEVRFVCLFYDADPSTKENVDVENVQHSPEVPPRDIELLSSDFRHLLEKEILPDVRLECGNRTFRAHRSVLAARSEVFRAMLQNDMLENKTGSVKISDVDVSVIEKLLKYVYTGNPGDISEGTAADLYEAADKYDVHSLKAACTGWIARNLSAENCFKYLAVADSHSDGDLKATVVSFILENPGVLKSETWAAFSREPSKLAIEVFQAYVASTVQ